MKICHNLANRVYRSHRFSNYINANTKYISLSIALSKYKYERYFRRTKIN